MKIVLFCEQKYAINILQPLEVEANKEGEHSVIWYVQPKNIPDFPLKDEVKWTNHTALTIPTPTVFFFLQPTTPNPPLTTNQRRSLLHLHPQLTAVKHHHPPPSPNKTPRSTTPP